MGQARASEIEGAAWVHHSVGDTLEVFERVDSVDAYVYVFLNCTSCFTCESELDALTNVERDRGRLAVYVFVSGASTERATRYATAHHWRARCIADPIDAYTGAYGIRASPVALLIDRNGVLQAIAKCGGSPSVLDHIDNVLARHGEGGNRIGSLDPSALLVVRDSNNSPVHAGLFTRTFFSRRTRTITMCDPEEKKLIVCDSEGHAKKVFVLAGLPRVLMVMNPTWQREDLIMMFTDIDPRTAVRLIHLFDIHLGRLRTVEIPDKGILHGFDMTQCAAPLDRGQFLVGITPGETRILWSGDALVALCDSAGHVHGMAATVYDSAFGRCAMSEVLSWSDYGFIPESGHVFVTQSPTSTITELSKEGSVIRTLKMRFGTQWQDFCDSLPDAVKAPPETYVRINTTIHRIDRIMFEGSAGDLVVSTMAIEYPPGVTDFKSPRARYHCTIHFLDSLGIEDTSRAIILPPNVRPFCIEPGRIGMTYFSEGKIALCWAQRLDTAVRAHE